LNISAILQSSQRAFPVGAPILELDSISLRFGGVKALTNISFNVLEHEVRAIIGPNGAGKSAMPAAPSAHRQFFVNDEMFFGKDQLRVVEEEILAQQRAAETSGLSIVAVCR